ncbi:MAG TPA: hypothetical protein VM759_06260, partial [Longimicrobium sp.]|nr:hypothetical protein [Longimicrobium sp.]
PLGDLWATEVAALAGGWSAPPEIEAAATAAGGIDALDTALRRLIDGRDAAEVEPFLPLPDSVPRWRVAEEFRRLHARLAEGALSAHPASKTALLLGGELPPEPLLPLGDLWATEVAALAGGWSAPPEIESVATAAGGIDALDAALRRYVDGRDARGLNALPRDVADRVREMLAAGRAARRDPRIVPKLGGRTLCIDLME